MIPGGVGLASSVWVLLLSFAPFRAAFFFLRRPPSFVLPGRIFEIISCMYIPWPALADFRYGKRRHPALSED